MEKRFSRLSIIRRLVHLGYFSRREQKGNTGALAPHPRVSFDLKKVLNVTITNDLLYRTSDRHRQRVFLLRGDEDSFHTEMHIILQGRSEDDDQKNDK